MTHIVTESEFLCRAGRLGTFWREGVCSAKLWGGRGGGGGQQEYGAHDTHHHEGTAAVCCEHAQLLRHDMQIKVVLAMSPEGISSMYFFNLSRRCCSVQRDANDIAVQCGCPAPPLPLLPAPQSRARDCGSQSCGCVARLFVLYERYIYVPGVPRS